MTPVDGAADAAEGKCKSVVNNATPALAAKTDADKPELNEQEKQFIEQMAGVVMTGGSSKVEGVIELAEEIFHLPVRLGVPKGVTGLTEVVCSPTNATGVGLLLFGHQQMRDAGEESAPRRGFGSILERMRSWFQGNF